MKKMRVLLSFVGVMALAAPSFAGWGSAGGYGSSGGYYGAGYGSSGGTAPAEAMDRAADTVIPHRMV